MCCCVFVLGGGESVCEREMITSFVKDIENAIKNVLNEDIAPDDVLRYGMIICS